jgi:hypothetical protein
MGDLRLESGEAAGGFRPADVEQIMTEVAKFLDEVMQKRRTR